MAKCSFGNVPFGFRLPSCFFAQLAMTMLPGYSEGSMGPDIHPYPEGEESALMVRQLSSVINSSDFSQKSSLPYIAKMETRALFKYKQYHMVRCQYQSHRTIYQSHRTYIYIYTHTYMYVYIYIYLDIDIYRYRYRYIIITIQ